MKIIAVANQRMGVGKTAITLSLGMALSERGLRILMVDLDPQAALSAACGVEEAQGASLANVLGGSGPGTVEMRDILIEVYPGHNCYLAPADLELTLSELGLNFRIGRESVLEKALETVSKEFDLAVLDCPSALGMLAVNALNSAQAVLIPTRPEIADLRSIKLFLTVLERIKQEINPDLETLGVLVTYYNRELGPHKAAIKAMREAGLPLLTVGIEEGDHEIEDQVSEKSHPIDIPGDPRTRTQLAKLVEQWLAGWRTWQPSITES